MVTILIGMKKELSYFGDAGIEIDKFNKNLVLEAWQRQLEKQ